MNKRISLAFLTALALAGSLHAQQLVDYHVTVRTGSKGSIQDVVMLLVGEKGNSHAFSMGRPNKKQDLKKAIQTPDLGIVHAIVLDLGGKLGSWNVRSVTVRRGVDSEFGNPLGFSEFNLNDVAISAKESGQLFKMTYHERPPVEITKEGGFKTNIVEATMVGFGDNRDGLDPIFALDFRETWSHLDSVQVSTSDETSVGASATLSYESPESKVAGKFGAQLSASFDRTDSNALTEAVENVAGSSFTWGFLVSADSVTLRRVTFDLPFKAQVYTANDGSGSRVVRSLNAQIDKPQSDVRKNLNDTAEPMMLSELAEEWIPHITSSQARDEVGRAVPNLVKRGWVINDLSAADFLALTGSPAPAPKVAEKPQPTVVEIVPAPKPTAEFLPKSEPAPAPASPTPTPAPTPAPKAATTVAPADLAASFSKFGHANGQVTVKLLVTNRGQTAAPASTAKIYMSRNKSADPRRDTSLGAETVPALQPGASATVIFRKKMPAEKADGMRLVALLDTDGQVAESNEENSFRPGMKLQADRTGSSEKADAKASKKDAKKSGKKGGKKKGGKKRRK